MGGAKIETSDWKVAIVQPEKLKDISFDYCLLAMKSNQAVWEQCLNELKLPEEKILKTEEISEWDPDLCKKIFDENILENPRNYRIDGVQMDLGDGHALPFYQKNFKMYDRFMSYLGEMTRKKGGSFIIDIGANVGDTLAAMWRHTEDKFVCIEPADAFFKLLNKNIQTLDNPGRVYAGQAFITDRTEELYQAVLSEKGTAVKKRIDQNYQASVSSKTVDCLVKERGIHYSEIDLLKIDTDGYDADCIISAKEMLKNGESLLFWENYIETYEQYERYLEAYRLLDSEGYSAYFIFDNYGNYLCKGNVDIINSVAAYMQRINTGCTGNAFAYFDVLSCKDKDVELCEKYIECYLKQFPLCRIHK